MKKIGVVLLVILSTINVRADEGMWLLSLLEGYTIEDMQKEGFRLTAEDIYSVNKACLKDAVVIFGGGCTGELVSPEGLILTNHHCGYGSIQRHSSVEHDYLTDGFWAMSREEELPNAGLSVQFLRYMKDVTEEVNKGTEELKDLYEAESLREENMQAIVDAALDGTHLRGYVRPMFYGNQYFLFVYERFTDIRLVGAPPSSIGNFGEDNDNWVWPRHTGDFSVFRIYADENNEPADYSKDNVPYKPAKFFEISMDGVEEGDFTMVLGYPGATERFLYSKQIETLMKSSLPLRIDLRTKRMDIMDKYMDQSDVVRIQYASKYRGVTNAWKKWQGAIKGLERMDAITRKVEFEARVDNWIKDPAYPERMAKYGNVLPGFERLYTSMEDYQVVDDLIGEAISPIEAFRFVSSITSMMMDSVDAEKIESRIEGLYKDYYLPLDREMFAVLIGEYAKNAPAAYYPEFFSEVREKYKNDFQAFALKTYASSYFCSKEKALELVALYKKDISKAFKKIKSDPMSNYIAQFRNIYGLMVLPQVRALDEELDQLYKIWVQVHFEFQPEKRQYPDANSTMRLTYGKVDGYIPEDAVKYEYLTTLEGVIEKSKLGEHDYIIPDRLKDIFEAKDYGEYGVNETMPVCFAASNHTSGGNSGSPVLNADGRLIGINFDRNWHGTMSDEMYDPDMCRNISVDIRYVLFIIDKYAGAGYLLDEMVLVRE